MGETAAREVLLTFKVAVDEVSRARATKGLEESVRQRVNSVKQAEREELRAQRNVDREAERAAKDQQQRDARMFRERMRVIREREREEVRVSREVERAANARARAEESAVARGKAANAQAVEGFRMLTGGVGQAIRALGYLAAADEKSAEAMAKVVLAVEGTIAGIQTLTTVGYGAVRMWQAYQMAQAAGNLSGGMRLLGMAGRALPAVAGVGAAVGGVVASGLPQRAMDSMAGRSGAPGSYNDRQAQDYINDVNAGSKRSWWQSASQGIGNFLDMGPGWESGAGWSMGSTRRRQREEAAAMARQSQADVSAAEGRSTIYNRGLAVRGAQDWGEASMADVRRRQRQEQEDLLWEAGPKDLAGATRRRVGAESEAASAKAALDLARESRKPGGRIEDVASMEKIVALEKQYADAIDRARDARRQEVDIDRTGRQAKIAGIRDTIATLKQEMEAHRNLAREAAAGGQSVLERLGSMSAVERAEAVRAKQAVDAGKGTLEQEKLVQSLSMSGGATDEAIRERWRQRALAEGGEAFSGEFDQKRAAEEKTTRELQARVKTEQRVVVKLEHDDQALLEQVAKEAAKQMDERNQMLWPMIERAIRDAIQERMQQAQQRNLNPVLGRGNG